MSVKVIRMLKVNEHSLLANQFLAIIGAALCPSLSKR